MASGIGVCQQTTRLIELGCGDPLEPDRHAGNLNRVCVTNLGNGFRLHGDQKSAVEDFKVLMREIAVAKKQRAMQGRATERPQHGYCVSAPKAPKP